MRRTLLLGIVVLMLTLIPASIGNSPPPPEEWPPKPKWYPMTPPESRTHLIDWYVVAPHMEGNWYIEPNKPFLFLLQWIVVPTNVGYLLEDTEGVGEARDEVTISLSLQDQTDHAYARYTITMSGEILEPTTWFTATCRWFTMWDPSLNTFVVVPTINFYQWTYEYPQGLQPGQYGIHLHAELAGSALVDEGSFDRYVTLHVGCCKDDSWIAKIGLGGIIDIQQTPP